MIAAGTASTHALAPPHWSRASPTVFVVDHDSSVRDSLESMIRSAGWESQTFASGREFLAVSPPDAPSCLILEMRLPDFHGLDVQQRLATTRLDMPVIFVSAHVDVPTTVRAMKAGAAEVLVKPVSHDVLLTAIGQAIERSKIALLDEAEALALSNSYQSLTARERDVMALVVAGLLNKQIAAELSISEITVKAHRGKVMRKMGVRSVAALVKLAARLEEAA